MASPEQFYNTPLETGVRSLCLLLAAFPESMSVDQLVFMDHVAVHTNDFAGPASLHPETPLRSAEPLVRRELIQKGLRLLKSRALADEIPTKTGFRWRACDEAAPFVECLETTYNRRLIECAKWTWDRFGGFSHDELSRQFGDRIATALNTEIAS